MKLASLKSGRDGRLVVVNKAMNRYVSVTEIAPTLQNALDNWSTCGPSLRKISQALEENQIASETFDPSFCDSPLPRAFHWVDGSAYVNHVEQVRKGHNAKMPKSLWSEPLVYQGGPDTFLDPQEPIQIADEAWGIDFEAEVAAIVDDVPMGVSEEEAGQHIQLLILVNDVSPRNLIPGELA